MPEIQSRGPVLNRGRDVYVVDHDYTQFVDSFEARIGGHQVIGADPQGRGEYHGVDGEQTVSGLQLQATSIVGHAMFLDANTHLEQCVHLGPIGMQPLTTSGWADNLRAGFDPEILFPARASISMSLWHTSRSAAKGRIPLTAPSAHRAIRAVACFECPSSA